MTIKEMLERVNRLKPMSRETLYVKIRVRKIKPVGERQCPQQYPDDAVEKILIPLGFTKHQIEEAIDAPRPAAGGRIKRPKNIRSRRAVCA